MKRIIIDTNGEKNGHNCHFLIKYFMSDDIGLTLILHFDRVQGQIDKVAYK